MSRGKNLPVVLACLFGFGVTLHAFYPGFVSDDSVGQLVEARSGVYTDWHPPLMAFVWRHVDRLVPGPGGMLALHLAALWSAIGIVAARTFSRGWTGASAALALGLFPPVSAIASTIWKDVGMGAAFALAFALLLVADETRRPRWIVPAALLAAYGVGVRHNAIAGAIPLALWAAGIVLRDRPVRAAFVARLGRGAPLVLGLVGALALFAGARLVTRALTRGATAHPGQQVLAHDLVAISVRTGQVELPAVLARQVPGVTAAGLAKAYTPERAWSLVCCDRSAPRLRWLTTDADVAELEARWWSAVRAHPGDYLAHREAVFAAQMGLRAGPVCYPLQFGMVRNELDLRYWEDPIGSLFRGVFTSVQDSLLFRGFAYLSLLLLLGLLVGRRARAGGGAHAAEAALVASGLAYALPYFFVSVACDFRLAWWSVLAALLAVMRLAPSVARGLLQSTRTRK